MLLLLFLPIVSCVALAWRYVQTYAPSNLLIRHVRCSPPHWSTVLYLLAVSAALLVAMHALAVAVARGAPARLNLVVFVLAWDAMKLAFLAIATALRVVTGGARRLVRHRSP